jgi:hypothetical protein
LLISIPLASLAISRQMHGGMRLSFSSSVICRLRLTVATALVLCQQ